MKVLLAICALFLASPLAAQTNPCAAAPIGSIVLSPTSEILATLPPEHTAILAGFPAITEYVIGVFLPGVDPLTGGQPVAVATVPKTAWVLKTGNCYGMLPLPAVLLAVPVNVERFAAMRSRRTLPVVVEGAWGPLTNPFGVLGVPAAPTGTRITP